MCCVDWEMVESARARLPPIYQKKLCKSEERDNSPANDATALKSANCSSYEVEEAIRVVVDREVVMRCGVVLDEKEELGLGKWSVPWWERRPQ